MKYTYKQLSQTWGGYDCRVKENFFVGYAVDGPIINPSSGLRAGLPVDHPIFGPVTEPSPLNSQLEYREVTHPFPETCS